MSFNLARIRHLYFRIFQQKEVSKAKTSSRFISFFKELVPGSMVATHITIHNTAKYILHNNYVWISLLQTVSGNRRFGLLDH